MSSAALVVHTNGAALVAPNIEERRRLLGDLIMRNGSEAQVDLVMHLCGHYNLDPLLKHLVLINGSAYITRDGLLHIAHQSGQFDGIEVELRKLDDGEWAATCSVFRKDKTRPFRYTVYQKEHQQKGGAWDKFPRAMLTKTAEVACLRRAFDVSLGAAEEVGYDGAGDRTHIGQAVIVEPPAPARPAMLDDDAVALLVTSLHRMDNEGVAGDAIRAHAADHAQRVTAEQWGAIKGAVQAIAARRKAAQASATGATDEAPEYRSAREDGQAVLGDTPEERRAMLDRIKAAIAASGQTERQVNAYVGAVYNVAAWEVLTAEQARELLAELASAAAGRADSALGAGGAWVGDDADEVPL